MEIQVINKPPEEINEKIFVQQTNYWSEVKKKQGFGSISFQIKVANKDVVDSEANGYQVEDVLVLLQPINSSDCIAYIPYGPYIITSEENKGPFLESLSEILQEYLPKNCIMIRYDLIWESGWAKEEDLYAEDQQWMGPPEQRVQEMRLNFNTINWNLRKSYTDILPSHTLLLNLKKENDALLNSMKSKTRYNIRLSERKNVEVREANEQELNKWLQLYSETAKRNGINYQNPDYFKTVMETKAKAENSPVEIKLLLAQKDEKPLAAIYLALTEKRATYLYGASSSENRNLMAPYALQWEALKTAKNYGCTEYDMFGVSPSADPAHPMYGLYRFKTGFGGEMFHRMGCWEYPLNDEKYVLFTAKEMNSQGYHLA